MALRAARFRVSQPFGTTAELGYSGVMAIVLASVAGFGVLLRGAQWPSVFLRVKNGTSGTARFVMAGPAEP
jgi:hypothetical protein